MDFVLMVHGFSAHKLITGLGIPTLVVLQRRLPCFQSRDYWSNCRVYWSTQFLNTDHRLVGATLKLQLKSGRMVPSQPRLDVGKLKDERVAKEFANRLSGNLGGLGALVNPEELCSAF